MAETTEDVVVNVVMNDEDVRNDDGNGNITYMRYIYDREINGFVRKKFR